MQKKYKKDARTRICEYYKYKIETNNKNIEKQEEMLKQAYKLDKTYYKPLMLLAFLHSEIDEIKSVKYFRKALKRDMNMNERRECYEAKIINEIRLAMSNVSK